MHAHLSRDTATAVQRQLRNSAQLHLGIKYEQLIMSGLVSTQARRHSVIIILNHDLKKS